MSRDEELSHHVNWFRQASPYINAHRAKTFVIALGDRVMEGDSGHALVHDMALLSHLGIHLVLVYGIRAQIDALERQREAASPIVNGLRVTDDSTLQAAIQAAGTVRVAIEAAFSSSLPNTPMSGARLNLVSGNFVTARPYGIHDGVDFRHTGVVRRAHARAIRGQLEAGNIVLLPPIGFSKTGETFNLRAEDVATATAIALEADKLIFLLEEPLGDTETGREIRQSTPAGIEALLTQGRLGGVSDNIIHNASRAAQRGVTRVHLLDQYIDGALLKELFTRDGIGCMISQDSYEGMRRAQIDDVGGIIALIEPFERDGTLVRRSREQLEMEIDNFTVIERDGMIVACAALYAMEGFAEVACVVTHDDYRNSGRAESLLAQLEAQAHAQGLKTLFVFTTRTRHWFMEQGFTEAALDDLPAERQDSYNFKRNSRVLTKPVVPPRKR